MKTKRGYTINVTLGMLRAFEDLTDYGGSRRHDVGRWVEGFYYKHPPVNEAFKLFLGGVFYGVDNHKLPR